MQLFLSDDPKYVAVPAVGTGNKIPNNILESSLHLLQ